MIDLYYFLKELDVVTTLPTQPPATGDADSTPRKIRGAKSTDGQQQQRHQQNFLLTQTNIQLGPDIKRNYNAKYRSAFPRYFLIKILNDKLRDLNQTGNELIRTHLIKCQAEARAGKQLSAGYKLLEATKRRGAAKLEAKVLFGLVDEIFFLSVAKLIHFYSNLEWYESFRQLSQAANQLTRTRPKGSQFIGSSVSLKDTGVSRVTENGLLTEQVSKVEEEDRIELGVDLLFRSLRKFSQNLYIITNQFLDKYNPASPLVTKKVTTPSSEMGGKKAGSRAATLHSRLESLSSATRGAKLDEMVKNLEISNQLIMFSLNHLGALRQIYLNKYSLEVITSSKCDEIRSFLLAYLKEMIRLNGEKLILSSIPVYQPEVYAALNSKLSRMAAPAKMPSNREQQWLEELLHSGETHLNLAPRLEKDLPKDLERYNEENPFFVQSALDYYNRQMRYKHLIKIYASPAANGGSNHALSPLITTEGAVSMEKLGEEKLKELPSSMVEFASETRPIYHMQIYSLPSLGGQSKEAVGIIRWPQDEKKSNWHIKLLRCCLKLENLCDELNTLESSLTRRMALMNLQIIFDLIMDEIQSYPGNQNMMASSTAASPTSAGGKKQLEKETVANSNVMMEKISHLLQVIEEMIGNLCSQFICQQQLSLLLRLARCNMDCFSSKFIHHVQSRIRAAQNNLKNIAPSTKGDAAKKVRLNILFYRIQTLKFVHIIQGVYNMLIKLVKRHDLNQSFIVGAHTLIDDKVFLDLIKGLD